MTRRNIFELMQEKYDHIKEVEKLSDLLEEDMILLGTKSLTLEEFVDEYEFDNWKNSYHYINCEDLKESLGINETIKFCTRGYGISIEDTLVFLEYVLNIINICQRSICIVHNEAFFTKPYPRLIKNIEILLSNLNYEYIYFDKEEKVILVERDSAAFAVADIVEEELAFKVIEYNHYLLKGDLDKKRNILKALADKVEGFGDNLNKSLFSDFGYLANNINIRHNNLEGKNKKEYLLNIANEELEDWYDETYQVMLLCILENNYKTSITNKIKEIKGKVK